MGELVNSLLEQSGINFAFVLRQTVKLLSQPVQGDNGCARYMITPAQNMAFIRQVEVFFTDIHNQIDKTAIVYGIYIYAIVTEYYRSSLRPKICIICINVADYGIVGDVLEVVPALIREIEKIQPSEQAELVATDVELEQQLALSS